MSEDYWRQIAAGLAAQLAAVTAELARWKVCSNCGQPLEAPGHCGHAVSERERGLEQMHEETLTRAEADEAEVARLRAQFQRSQQRWGNLEARIRDEIASFENPCLSTQQRNQYANGVARLRWVLREMQKSPDVLAEALPAPTPEESR